MDEDSAKRSVGRLAVAFLIGDLFLALLVLFQDPMDRTITAILIGTLIGQFSLGCAAILRNESLREGAIGWLALLVSASGLLPVVFNQADVAGYILLFALIIAGVCLATNLLPTFIFRSFTSKRGFQFSILHIMLLMTLVGISIVVASLTNGFILVAIGVGLLLVAPSAIGCLLVGVLTQKRAYLACMTFIVLLIGAGWMLATKATEIWLSVMAQTLTMAVGGYVLMLVELGIANQCDPNLAATESLPRSEPVPGPFDEP